MTVEEMNEFRKKPGFEDAIQLRLWDDLAKVPGQHVPDLDSYRDVVEACAYGEGAWLARGEAALRGSINRLH